jgi:hypothetical protein
MYIRWSVDSSAYDQLGGLDNDPLSHSTFCAAQVGWSTVYCAVGIIKIPGSSCCIWLKDTSVRTEGLGGIIWGYADAQQSHSGRWHLQQSAFQPTLQWFRCHGRQTALIRSLTLLTFSALDVASRRNTLFRALTSPTAGSSYLSNNYGVMNGKIPWSGRRHLQRRP